MKRKLLLALLLAVLLPACALGASYEIESLEMRFDIQRDGSALIEELILYEFSGSYNGFLATIRHEDAGMRLSDLRLYTDVDKALRRVDVLGEEPLTYTVESAGDVTRIKAYVPGESGPRSLLLTYRIDGYAQRYRDTGYLRHTLLRSEEAYRNVSLAIHLPEVGEGVDAFLHGPSRDGRVETGGILYDGPFSVAEGQEISAHILFPAEWLSEAAIIDQPMREAALSEEARYQEEVAAAAASAARTQRILRTALLVLFCLYAVLSLLAFLRMQRRDGLKQDIPPRTDDALLGSLAVAEAQLLMQGGVDASGLSATLLELTEKGALRLSNVEGETLFTPLARPGGLTGQQGTLLGWLFPGEEPLAISSLDAGEDGEAAERFIRGYDAWKRQVREDCVAHGYLQDNRTRRAVAMVLTAVFGGGLCIALLLTRQWPLAIACGLLAILLPVAFSRIRRVTDAGEDRIAALEGFLDNYRDTIETAPHTLVGRTPLIMALGYLKPLADAIDAHPEAEGSLPDTSMLWMYPAWHHGLLSMQSTIDRAQRDNAALHAASQQESGGGSSGGGFSGGSGGSSHGAW